MASRMPQAQAVSLVDPRPATHGICQPRRVTRAYRDGSRSREKTPLKKSDITMWPLGKYG